MTEDNVGQGGFYCKVTSPPVTLLMSSSICIESIDLGKFIVHIKGECMSVLALHQYSKMCLQIVA